jgi:hypothetical protein
MMSDQHKHTALRLQFLARVVSKECRHLISTDQRLFDTPFSIERAGQLETDPELSERVEAFVGRFGRLQDTIGDKLLPTLLVALGETPAAAIDNLNRAERLGLLDSVEEWMTMRQLRNQMVHEYVEDLAVLANALQTGHGFVTVIVAAANTLLAEIERRGWA